MPDAVIDLLNRKISDTLGFFGSGLRYEYSGGYRGSVYFRENGKERVVFSLSLTYDGDELYPALSPENGYENPALEGQLLL